MTPDTSTISKHKNHEEVFPPISASSEEPIFVTVTVEVTW